MVGLGIDEQGEKHALGLDEGATENELVGKALIEDLIARGWLTLAREMARFALQTRWYDSCSRKPRGAPV